MTIDSTEKSGSSWRWKFSIRSLIVFVTLICVCASVFSRWLQWKQYQKKWTNIHARVNEDASCGEDVTNLTYFGGVDGFVAEILKLPNLKTLYIKEPNLAAIPPELKELSSLESLAFFSCPIT